MIDKNLQMLILQEAAAHYPHPIPTGMPKFLEAIHDKTMRERLHIIAVNLHALQEIGYVKRATFVDYDGILHLNKDFSITVEGLLAIGVESLHPDPGHELREILFKQAQELRKLNDEQQSLLKEELRRTPFSLLEYLRNKGLDVFLSKLFGI